MTPAITSRRALLGLSSAGAIALAAPSFAAKAPWDAHDWMRRWKAQGCGLSLGRNALTLKGRLNGDRDAIGALMMEIAPAERQTAVINVLERLNDILRPDHDPAMAIVHKLKAIDAECVFEDEDPVAHRAWIERWEAALDRLSWTPATSPAGRAAKLRYGIEYAGTDAGDRLIAQVVGWLERYS